MLFAFGFIAQFVIGGISGVMTAAVPFDWQATDTYFVVAHIHYVLAGGTLFGVFAAIYYWYPKMFGRLLDERTGKISFWLMFVGFNLAFFPMHISGLLGMPRRVYTYASSPALDTANLLSTIGAYMFAVGDRRHALECAAKPRRRCDGRAQSVGRRHARVGDRVATRRLQLRAHPGRERQRPIVARRCRRRSGVRRRAPNATHVVARR